MKQLSIIANGIKEIEYIRSFKNLKLFFPKMIKEILGARVNFYPYYEVPPIIQIEPTNYCNLHCLCCSTPRSSDQIFARNSSVALRGATNSRSVSPL